MKNAFPHGDLHEVHMAIPPEFAAQGKRGMVCKLQKGSMWAQTIPSNTVQKSWQVILALGYKRNNDHHTLFVRGHYGITATIVLVHDIIITSDNLEKISKVKRYLSKVFEIIDFGDWSFEVVLRIEIARINVL